MELAANTHDPLAVAAQVRSDYQAMFPAGSPLFVPQVFGWAIDAFNGRYSDYLPVDTRYHDLEHTLQGTLCLSKLLRGRSLAQAQPAIPQRVFELAIIAILLHDTGYLKHRSDTVGTGAKYTRTHVLRSCAFAEELLISKSVSAEEIRSVQNMIRCTGTDAQATQIQFTSEAERVAGYALGTADLLGQMAASDYVDKLPVLYEEFRESAQFSGADALPFRSAEDLLRQTPGFWEKFVFPKIETEFLGLYRFLASPPPNGLNPYVERILANMQRLRQKVSLAA
jgi:hypothetical protein